MTSGHYTVNSKLTREPPTPHPLKKSKYVILQNIKVTVGLVMKCIGFRFLIMTVSNTFE